MSVTSAELKQRQAWTLDMKLEYFCMLYSQFIIHCKGQIYLSFSAGMDSQTGCDIIAKIHDGTFKHITPQWERVVKYPMPPLVFSNTGLEYPEIVDNAKKFEHVLIKPKMGWTRVLQEVGVALISKDVSQKLREIRNTKSKKLRDKRMYGDANGNGKLPLKWRELIDAPFEISERCCEVLKKEPFRRYESETGRRPVVFTTIDEGGSRGQSYLRTGCNSFEDGHEKSRPFSIFTKADTWEYAMRWNIRFAEVYYDRTIEVKQMDGSVQVEDLKAVDRTGCTFCLFGIHLETGENRMQKMARSHPKFHDLIINKYGLSKILDYIKIPYYPSKNICGKQQSMF